MTEPAPETPVENVDTPPVEAEPEDRLKQVTSKYEAERRARTKLEKELAQLRNAQLSESEKVVEEARAVGRKEGAKAAGVRLAAAEFRTKAAEAKLPPMNSILDMMDLTKFVDDSGEPDMDLIAETVNKLAESLVAQENGKATPRAPEIPKGVHPKSAESDWLRTAMHQD